MMRYLSSRILWGVILVLGGIAMLLQNLDILAPAGSLFWALIFFFAGAAFLSIYFQNRDHWWAFIPAFLFIGLGLSAVVEIIFPTFGDELGGALFLGGISIGFAVIYIINRQNWWAIIPAGVLATLAVVSIVDSGVYEIDSGAIFFMGIGLTFGVLALLPGYENALKWAYIPAGVLLLIGLLISATSGGIVNLIIPSLFILIGLFVVVRTMLRKDA